MAQSRTAPMIPPMNWKTMYPTASLVSILLSTYIPMVMAGLMWHPDTRPMQYAMATTDRPKASAVPTTPAGVKHPTTTATPHPTMVRTMVPMSSATYFLMDSLAM